MKSSIPPWLPERYFGEADMIMVTITQFGSRLGFNLVAGFKKRCPKIFGGTTLTRTLAGHMLTCLGTCLHASKPVNIYQHLPPMQGCSCSSRVQYCSKRFGLSSFYLPTLSRPSIHIAQDELSSETCSLCNSSSKLGSWLNALKEKKKIYDFTILLTFIDKTVIKYII